MQHRARHMQRTAGRSRPRRTKPGIPGWVVTFGDMMALLLCFFILLQMFSEFKKDHEYQRVVTAIQEAFGFTGGVGVLPTDDIPARSMIEILESMSTPAAGDVSATSRNQDEGIEGPHARVTRVAEGVQFTIGGVGLFALHSAEITDSGRAELARFAKLLAGRRNVVLIRGHAASTRLPADSQWSSLDELSFARAQTVHGILLAEGLDDRVFRLEAVGDREPIDSRAMSEQALAEHRRVDIILTERMAVEPAGTPERDSTVADAGE
jgi:chemotaxis protein MotB